jgi:SAM-dependent methyltransferase
MHSINVAIFAVTAFCLLDRVWRRCRKDERLRALNDATAHQRMQRGRGAFKALDKIPLGKVFGLTKKSVEGVLQIWTPIAAAAAAACDRAEQQIASLFREMPARETPEWAALNNVARKEFETMFGPLGYSMSGAEMNPQQAWRLVELFNLAPDESFVDLGSSFGRIPLLVALATSSHHTGRVAGVELSPSRTVAALEARERLKDSNATAAARLDFLCADVFSSGDSAGQREVGGVAMSTVDLSSFDCIYCAVQPRAARCSTADLLKRLVHDYRSSCREKDLEKAPRLIPGQVGKSPGQDLRTVRVYTAGFHLLEHTSPVEGCSVQFVSGHAFQLSAQRNKGGGPNGSNGSNGSGDSNGSGSGMVPTDAAAAQWRGGSPPLDSLAPLYGRSKKGPRVVLEYVVVLSPST